jgi:hypothetical protein
MDRMSFERMSPYADHGSWAVWGPLGRNPAQPFTATSDISFPELADGGLDRLLPFLNTRAVIVGLNPGNAYDPGRAPWDGHHYGGRSNDHLSAEAFRDTPYWGSYLTDLFRIVESDSRVLDATLAADAIAVSTGITQWIAEVQDLQADNPVIICIGVDSFTQLMAHADRLGDELAIRPERIVRILHYSATAAGHHRNDPAIYRRKVELALSEAGVL